MSAQELSALLAREKQEALEEGMGRIVRVGSTIIASIELVDARDRDMEALLNEEEIWVPIAFVHLSPVALALIRRPWALDGGRG